MSTIFNRTTNIKTDVLNQCSVSVFYRTVVDLVRSKHTPGKGSLDSFQNREGRVFSYTTMVSYPRIR